jgi:hypothetical protein
MFTVGRISEDDWEDFHLMKSFLEYISRSPGSAPNGVRDSAHSRLDSMSIPGVLLQTHLRQRPTYILKVLLRRSYTTLCPSNLSHGLQQ